MNIFIHKPEFENEIIKATRLLQRHMRAHRRGMMGYCSVCIHQRKTLIQQTCDLTDDVACRNTVAGVRQPVSAHMTVTILQHSESDSHHTAALRERQPSYCSAQRATATILQRSESDSHHTAALRERQPPYCSVQRATATILQRSESDSSKNKVFVMFLP